MDAPPKDGRHIFATCSDPWGRPHKCVVRYVNDGSEFTCNHGWRAVKVIAWAENLESAGRSTLSEGE